MVFRPFDLPAFLRHSDETGHTSVHDGTRPARIPKKYAPTPIPEHISESLIGVGRAIRSEVPPNSDELSSFRRYDSINRKGREFWSRTASPLTDEEVADLARGLTYVETQLKWSGGSVSGVIWLFHELIDRNTKIELLDELSSWILRNTSNPYNPFGTRISLGAKNYSEYRTLSLSRAQRINKYVDADARLGELARAEQEKRRKMAAAGDKARNTPLRAEIIQALNPLPLAEKLMVISADPTFPPQFFPTSIADSATQEVVDALPEDVRRNLARRLKGRKRGPWRNFRKRLVRSLGEIWNKEPWWGV